MAYEPSALARLLAGAQPPQQQEPQGGLMGGLFGLMQQPQLPAYSWSPLMEGRPGQMAANTPPKGNVEPLKIMPGAGNTTYRQRADGVWVQYDNIGPVGPMPQGWQPSPIRAPGY